VLYDRYNILWELLLQEMLTETFERKFVLKNQSRNARQG